MPSHEDDAGSHVLHHLGRIAVGECSITQEEILAFHERGDDLTGELLAGLLYLHGDLVHREEARRAANERLEQTLARLREQNQELTESRASLAVLADALSTPIIKAGNGVLLAPLIGSIDDARAATTLERILGAVSRERARVLILDLTGISRVDSRAAELFGRILRSARLLGARTIVAGVQPQVADAITRLDSDLALGGATIVRDVQAAMRLCNQAERGRGA
jgi:anti-anti-sigma regulatory factor